MTLCAQIDEAEANTILEGISIVSLLPGGIWANRHELISDLACHPVYLTDQQVSFAMGLQVPAMDRLPGQEHGSRKWQADIICAASLTS
jgi:hypothetical protein